MKTFIYRRPSRVPYFPKIVSAYRPSKTVASNIAFAVMGKVAFARTGTAVVGIAVVG